jgi:hypothetical protein
MSLPFTGGGRRCGTCRFYRSSPIPGQGWCTHPELVKPPAMVLVKARELNCARPLSEIPDRWEPLDPRHHAPPPRPSLRIRAVTPASLAPERPPEAARPTYGTTEPIELDGRLDEPPSPAEDGTPEPTSDEQPDGDTAQYREADPFPPRHGSSNRWLLLVGVPIALCLLLGIAGAIGFVATNGFGAALVGGPAPTPTRAAGIAGIAKQDFRLRSEARSDSEQRSVVRTGTRLQLINSAAGEILDPSLPEPAKWYLVQTADGTAQGWAYSGWIERQS